MSYEDLIIKYNGFHPTDEVHNYIQTVMEGLLDQAPYGAFLEANFIKKNRLFKGIIRIKSPTGPFFCAASNDSLVKLSDQLTKKMYKNLDKWRLKRFQPSQESATRLLKAINVGVSYDQEIF